MTKQNAAQIINNIQNYKHMKKAGFIFMAVLFGLSSILNAQTTVRQQMHRQMRQYIETGVLPFIRAERSKLINALTDSEKENLKELQQEFVSFRLRGKQIRENKHGQYTKQMVEIRKNVFDGLKAKANSLLASHPKEAKVYKQAIDEKKHQWIADMKAMRLAFKEKKLMQHDPFDSMLAKKMDDPVFALLWDGKKIPWNKMMPKSEMYKAMNVHSKSGKAKQKHILNPRTREKVLAYAKQNIIPEINTGRNAFDKKLSKKEKKQIDKARRAIESRKERFCEIRAGEYGQVSDSVRLAMQVKMQETMLKVRKIALKHYSEIQPYLNKIKANIPEWRKGISQIISENTDITPTPKNSYLFFDKIKRLNTPVSFLLFDKNFFAVMKPVLMK